MYYVVNRELSCGYSFMTTVESSGSKSTLDQWSCWVSKLTSTTVSLNTGHLFSEQFFGGI